MAAQSSSNVTDTLPADILDLILREVKRNDTKSLQSLRLASKGFNDLVEPLAFSSVQLISYTRLKEFQAQLRRLASGQSPNSRYTKRLDIGLGSLAPLIQSQYRGASAAGPRRHSALVTQKKYLVRAIETLTGVTFARYHPQDTEPYEEVLGAISRLPSLEHISLSFSSDFDDEPLPLSSFTNLRVIDLEYPRFFPSVVAAIQGMLESSSATLESLIVMPFSWERQFGWGEPPFDTPMLRVVGLDTLLEGVEKPPLTIRKTGLFARLSNHVRAATGMESSQVGFGPRYPKLKRVSINTNRIGLTAAVVQYLPSLVHLDALNAMAGNIDDSFWRELTRRRVRLEFLRVWPLTTSTMDYLASYTGLKTLFLRDPEDKVTVAFARERQLDRLVTVILPRHSHTLENLWLEGSGEGEYCVTEQILEGVTRCYRLQNLWILYHFPDNPNTVSECEVSPETDNGYGFVKMDILLSRLTTSLPKLQHLILRPIRQTPRFGCGTGEVRYMSKVAAQFRDAISQAEVTGGTPSFAISVRGAMGGCMMYFDEEKKRFVVDDTWVLGTDIIVP